MELELELELELESTKTGQIRGAADPALLARTVAAHHTKPVASHSMPTDQRL